MGNLFLAIHWAPDPEAFSIGSLSIKWYGLLWAASLMWVYFIQRYAFKALGKDDEKVALSIQYVFLGGLIGARLGHVLFYQLDFYLADPMKVFYVWEGGLASHGGLAGGIIGLYLFTRWHKEFTMLWIVDIGAIAVPMLAALIRIGNLLNSELYGVETNVPWAFIFDKVDDVPRHPVVLYESIVYMILQGIMFYVFSKYKDGRPGIYIATLLVGLFGTRFLLEFMKEPEGDMILGIISKTQLLNVPFVLTGLVIGYYSLKRALSYGYKRKV